MKHKDNYNDDYILDISRKIGSAIESEMTAIRQVRKGDKIAWPVSPFGNYLFHPDHAVPFLAFIAAQIMLSHQRIAHFFMEMDTCIRQVLIVFTLSDRNAGI